MLRTASISASWLAAELPPEKSSLVSSARLRKVNPTTRRMADRSDDSSIARRPGRGPRTPAQASAPALMGGEGGPAALERRVRALYSRARRREQREDENARQEDPDAGRRVQRGIRDLRVPAGHGSSRPYRPCGLPGQEEGRRHQDQPARLRGRPDLYRKARPLLPAQQDLQGGAREGL